MKQLILNEFYLIRSNSIIIQLQMLFDGQRSRSWHSQDKRRSISREEARRQKLQKVKMRFKNIATRIRQIKNQNTSDLTQLSTLMRNSQQIERMACQSIEKASLFLSESKFHKKRFTSPNYQQAKHSLPHVQEFIFETKNEKNNATSTKADSVAKRKVKSGKRTAAPSRIKTDETIQSEALRQCNIAIISEIQLHQECSRVKEQSAHETSQELLDDLSPPQETIKELPTTIEVQPEKLLRQSTSDSSLFKYGSKNHSLKDSLRASSRKSSTLGLQSKKSDSIYPYIAAILFSIVFLVLLRE